MAEEVQEQRAGIDPEALEKAIANVEAEANTLSETVIKSSPESRMQDLMAKGLDATDDEMNELRELLSPKSSDSIGSGISKSFGENDSLQKAISTDVTGYLQKSTDAVISSLIDLGGKVEELSAEDQRTQRTLITIAKSVVAQGDLLKAIASEVQSIGRSEAAPPKAVRADAAQSETVEKSFAQDFEAPARTTLSKGMVLNVLEEMTKESTLGKSMFGTEDLMMAVAGIEIGKAVPVEMQEEVLRRVQSANN